MFGQSSYRLWATLSNADLMNLVTKSSWLRPYLPSSVFLWPPAWQQQQYVQSLLSTMSSFFPFIFFSSRGHLLFSYINHLCLFSLSSSVFLQTSCLAATTDIFTVAPLNMARPSQSALFDLFLRCPRFWSYRSSSLSKGTSASFQHHCLKHLSFQHHFIKQHT